MNFALERTQSALSLLALEKSAHGYYIHHFDKRPLPQMAQRQASLLHEMVSLAPEPITDLTVGIHDSDLLIQQMHIPLARNHLNIYQQCQNFLAKALCLKNYSWDAEIIATDHDGYTIFCAAYPLKKIIFLQEILTMAKVAMSALEPSVCASARAHDKLLSSQHAPGTPAFELSQYIQCKNPYWINTEGQQLLAPIGLAMRSEIND